MKLRLFYIFSFLTLLVISKTTTQAQDQDSVTATLTPRHGLEIYVDYAKLLTFISDFESKAQLGITYRIKNKFAPVIEAGYGELNPSAALTNGTYTSSGLYAKAGFNYLLDYNTNTFYFGVRYAISRFEDNVTYEIESDIWNNFDDSFSRKELKASWYEFIFGSEMGLKQSHWSAGGFFSLRLMDEYDKFEPFDVFAIPGYGRAFDSSIPAVNLYIKYGIY